MIKVGDKAKGFEFAEQEHGHKLLAMTTSMYWLVGAEGTITEINRENDSFMIEFGDSASHHPKVVKYRWWYPLGKYLEMRREERLNELGILCDAEISQSEILDDVEIPQKSGGQARDGQRNWEHPGKH